MNTQTFSVRLITESWYDFLFIISNDMKVFETKTILVPPTPIIPIETFTDKSEALEAFKQHAWNVFKTRQDDVTDTKLLNLRLNEIFDDVYSRLKYPEKHILYLWDTTSSKLPFYGTENYIEFDLTYHI